MPKVKYPIVNFGKKYKASYVGALTNTEEHVVVPDEIDGTTKALRDSLFANNKVLETIDFNHSTVIPANCCSGCTALTTITFGDVQEAGSFAFSGCTGLQSVDLANVAVLGASMFANDTGLTAIDLTNVTSIGASAFSGCTNLTSVTIPAQGCAVGDNAFNNNTKITFTDTLDNFTSIGKSAFYSVGSAAAEGFDYHSTVTDPVYIGEAAFRYAKLEELVGKFQLTGINAFANISTLTKINATFHGDIPNYALYNDQNVADFTLTIEACRSLGEYAFWHCGDLRTDPTSNWFMWDFRPSVILTVPQYAWAYNKASIVQLPKTLTQINSYAFANGSDIIVYLNSLPKLSSTNVFTSTTNLSIVVDCNLDAESLKVASNWSTYAANIHSGIVGYVGELPPYNDSEGVSVTWYSDDTMTTQVTEATEANKIYYASKGSVREVYNVSGKLMDAQLEISDGSSTYSKFIPVGATVTVTPVAADPAKPELYLLQVDGVDCTAAGFATITADHDVKVVALYWDGEHYPFFPTLGDNSLTQLKLASQLNIKLDSWHVGDEIQVPFNGGTYAFRLVDMTGKVLRASDRKPANFLFESVNVVDVGGIMKQMYNHVTISNYLVNTKSEYGNRALTRLNTGDLWDSFSDEFKSVVEDVIWPYYDCGSTYNMSTVELRVFYACWSNLSDEQSFGHDGYGNPYKAPQKELNSIDVDEYYLLPGVTKRKTDITGTARYWYTITKETGSHPGGVSYLMLQHDSYGSGSASTYTYGDPGSSGYIAPRFAL